jgi:hypothetical protein
MQYKSVITSWKILSQLALFGSMTLIIGCNQKSESEMPAKQVKQESVYSTTATPEQARETVNDDTKVEGSMTEEPEPGLFKVSGFSQVEQPCGMNTQGSRIKCPSYRMISTSIQVIDIQRQQVVSVVTSDSSGDFSLSLKQGNYQLVANKLPLMKADTVDFTVTSAEVTGLKITYRPAIQPR